MSESQPLPPAPPNNNVDEGNATKVAVGGEDDPQTPEGEEENPEEMIGGLFSNRKPKDTVAGISSGLKSVLKGTVFGAASLVSLPIIGAQEEGAMGFAKG